MAAFSRLDGNAVASIAGLRPARLSPNLRAGLGPEYFSNLLGKALVILEGAAQQRKGHPHEQTRNQNAGGDDENPRQSVAEFMFEGLVAQLVGERTLKVGREGAECEGE